MFESSRTIIMDAVSRAVSEGLVSGKVIWADRKTLDFPHGNCLDGYKPLIQEFFEGGSAEGISLGMRDLIHEEALRQLATGAYKH